MRLLEDQIVDLELGFIEYCYTFAVRIGDKPKFLIHQKAYFYGVINTLELLHKDTIKIDEWTDKIIQGQTIFDLSEFNQLTLELVNNKAQAAIKLRASRKAKRALNRELKQNNHLSGWD